MIRDVPIIRGVTERGNPRRKSSSRGRIAGNGAASGRLRGLGDAVAVSAGIVNATTESGEPLDPGSFGMYFGDTEGGGSQPPVYNATGPGVTIPAIPATGQGFFTSPNAYASGTGFGLLNLPSPFGGASSTVAKTLSMLVWIALGIGVVWVVKEARS